MTDVITAIGSIALLLVAFCRQPQIASCPPRWYVNGVQPSGVFGCRPIPPIEPDARGHEPDPPPRDDPELYGQIYCTSGTQPIYVNFRVVGCTR